MKKLNILRVMGYPFAHYGTLERYLVHLSRECQKKGHRVFLHFDSDSLPYEKEFVDDVLAAGGEFVGFRRRNKIDFHFLLSMINLIQWKKIDVVHSYFSPSCHLASFAAWRCGVKAIFRTIGSMPYTHEVRFRTVAMMRQKLLAFPVVKFITVCEAIKEAHSRYSKIDKERFQVIYGGVDLVKLNSSEENNKEKIKKELNINDKEKVIGAIAALELRKGIEYLIDAVPLILEKVPNIKLVLVGEGILENDLRRMGERLNISSNLLFAGRRNDVDAIVSVLDVSVLPSIFGEGLSSAILESMAGGKPVVATNFGGTPEIIESEKNGLIVPPRDSAALANAILRLLMSDELALRLGVEGRKIVERKFDIQIRAKKELELYEHYTQ